MNKLEELRKYIYEDHQVAFLTFTVDKQGLWMAGYMTPKGDWLRYPITAEHPSLEAAANNLYDISPPNLIATKDIGAEADEK